MLNQMAYELNVPTNGVDYSSLEGSRKIDRI